MNYKRKYVKYLTKYKKLKKDISIMKGGGDEFCEMEDIEDFLKRLIKFIKVMENIKCDEKKDISDYFFKHSSWKENKRLNIGDKEMDELKEFAIRIKDSDIRCGTKKSIFRYVLEKDIKRIYDNVCDKILEETECFVVLRDDFNKIIAIISVSLVSDKRMAVKVLYRSESNTHEDILDEIKKRFDAEREMRIKI